MPPPQQGAPAMEVKKETEHAMSGHMQANRKEAFLDPAVCLICLDHTFGPAVVVTASCGHHFHPKCIEDAMRRNPAARTKCPCGAAIPPGREPVADAARMHKQMMNGIEVQCPQGCGRVMPFEKVRAHVQNADGCPSTPYRCGNAGCQVLFLRNQKDAHLRSCPHRLVPCELCQQQVKCGELQQHKVQQCPQRKVRCPHCEGEHCFSDRDQHMRGCTGAVQMMNLEELRVMMSQLRDQVAECRQANGLQGDIMFEQQQTITQLQQTTAQQQHTIERQQRELAELRQVTGPLREEQRRREEEERRREEQQRRREEQQCRPEEQQRRRDEERLREEREWGPLPQRLMFRQRVGLQHEYSLRPERVNGAAVWGHKNARIYRSLEGYWAVTARSDGPQRNSGHLRLTSQPGSAVPLGAGGWECCTAGHNDLSRADYWKPRPAISVTAA